MNIITSPLKYMGNKSKLMPTIKQHLPEGCDTFIDVFGGSGVVSANVDFKTRLYSENNINTFEVVQALRDTDPRSIEKAIRRYSKKYKLDGHNAEGFERMKVYANKLKCPILFWICARHAHSNLFRFNGSREFNVKFGKRSLLHRIDEVMDEVRTFQSSMRTVKMYNGHYAELLNNIQLGSNVCVYLDPPYYASGANIYGKWTLEDELKLLRNIKRLHVAGCKIMLSNVLEHRHFQNAPLKSFIRHMGFDYLSIDHSYCLANNVRDSHNTKEILMTNYL